MNVLGSVLFYNIRLQRSLLGKYIYGRQPTWSFFMHIQAEYTINIVSCLLLLGLFQQHRLWRSLSFIVDHKNVIDFF